MHSHFYKLINASTMIFSVAADPDMNSNMKRGLSFDEVSFRHAKRLEERVRAGAIGEDPMNQFVLISNLLQQQAHYIVSNSIYEQNQMIASENQSRLMYFDPMQASMLSESSSGLLNFDYGSAIIPPSLPSFYGNLNSEGMVVTQSDVQASNSGSASGHSLFVWPDSLKQVFDEKSLDEWQALADIRTGSKTFVSLVYLRFPDIEDQVGKEKIKQWYSGHKAYKARQVAARDKMIVNASAVSSNSEVQFSVPTVTDITPDQASRLPLMSSPPRPTLNSASPSMAPAKGFKITLKVPKAMATPSGLSSEDQEMGVPVAIAGDEHNVPESAADLVLPDELDYDACVPAAE